MKVKLFCKTCDLHSEDSDIIIVDENATDSELEQKAKDFFYYQKEPRWWFKRLTDDELNGEEL